MSAQRTAGAMPEHRRRIKVEGHPGIYRRGERFQVPYRLPNGRQKWKSVRTLTEAKRFKKQADAGNVRPQTRQSFKSYAQTWLPSYAGRTSRGVGDGTRESYRAALDGHAIPFFNTTRLDAIDPPMLRAYIDHLAGKGLAPATVRRYYAPVRALLSTAYDDGLLMPNPAAGVRVIVQNKRPRRPRRLTPEQTRALLDAMPSDHVDLAFFLAATGVRISEALSAVWADLDNDGGPVLTVPKSKTDAGERTIELTPETARRLMLRRASAPFNRDTDPIFPNAVGLPMDPHNYRRRVFKPVAVAVGVPWATPHMLRHSLATLMAMNGYGPEAIATHLGHADGGVLALRTYIHPERTAAPTFIDALAVVQSKG